MGSQGLYLERDLFEVLQLIGSSKKHWKSSYFMHKCPFTCNPFFMTGFLNFQVFLVNLVICIEKIRQLHLFQEISFFFLISVGFEKSLKI